MKLNSNIEILILPGWMHTHKNWENVVGMLSSEFFAHVIDLPGFGAEAFDSKLATIDDYANWVTTRIQRDYLNKKIVLLGHSFGGRIASFVAAQNPKLLSKLILYGAPSIYRPTNNLKLIAQLVKIKNTLLGNRSLGLMQSDDFAAVKGTQMQPIFEKNVRFDQTDLLKKIAVPTLLIWGETDTEVRLPIAQEMHTLIQGSDLKTIPAIGHNAHMLNPYLFYAYVKDFIKNS